MHRPGGGPEVLAHDDVGQRQRRRDHRLDHPAHVDADERVVGRLDHRPEHHRRRRDPGRDEVDVVDAVDRREVGAEAEAHDRQVGDRLEEARREAGGDRSCARRWRCAATCAGPARRELVGLGDRARRRRLQRLEGRLELVGHPGVAVLERLVDAGQVGVGGLVDAAEAGQRLGQAPPGVALVLGELEVGAAARPRRPRRGPRAAARWRSRSARARRSGPRPRGGRSSRVGPSGAGRYIARFPAAAPGVGSSLDGPERVSPGPTRGSPWLTSTAATSATRRFREDTAEGLIKRAAAHHHEHHGGPAEITPEIEAALRASVTQV